MSITLDSIACTYLDATHREHEPRDLKAPPVPLDEIDEKDLPQQLNIADARARKLAERRTLHAQTHHKPSADWRTMPVDPARARAIMQAIEEAGTTTRVELGHVLSLGAHVIEKTTRRLAAEGLIVERRDGKTLVMSAATDWRLRAARMQARAA